MKVKRTIALLIMAVMLLTVTPISVLAEPVDAEEGAGLNTTEVQVATLLQGESVISDYTFITKEQISEEWKKGSAYTNMTSFYYGIEGKVWRACKVTDDTLIFICDPSNAYGTSVYGSGIAGHKYEGSALDNAITALYSDTTHFTAAEIELMKDVSVTYKYQNYMFNNLVTLTTTRKLYAPGVNDLRNNSGSLKFEEDSIEVGGSNYYVANSLLPLQTSDSIWLRDISYKKDFNVYSLEGGAEGGAKVVQAEDSDSTVKNVVPVFQLKLNDTSNTMLFASLAQPAQANAVLNEAMTLRYDGSDKIKYSAAWNSSGVHVNSTHSTEGEYLYVQWDDGGTTHVKSIALNSAAAQDYKVTAEEIGGSGFAIPEDAKVWIEKKDETANLTYAVMAIKEKEEGPEAPVNLTGGRTSANGVADGTITGLDAGLIYEYKEKGAEYWKTVTAGKTSIENLAAGNYLVRIAGTDTHKAGASAECKVYNRYEVTVDKTAAQAYINETDAGIYTIKTMFDLAWVYEGMTAKATASKYIGNAVVDVLSGKFKAEGSEDPVYAKVDAIKKQMDELKTQVSELNLSLDKQTQEILGATDAAQMKSMLTSVAKQADNIETKYYNTAAYENAIESLDKFYDGKMEQNESKTEATDETKDIDETMHYFFSSDYDKALRVSPMTGSNYLASESKGREFLTDILNLGNEFLANHALNVEKNQKNIFDMYEGVCSYNYNFNAQTFALREKFNENAYNYYEKGYAVLATAITYEMNNHQIVLDEIDALEKAKASADEEEAQIIQKSLDYICTETTDIYDKKVAMTLSDVKRLHRNAIQADKKDLQNLKNQYELVLAARNNANESLQIEMNSYNNGSVILCYRDGQYYNCTLKYISVNQDYVNNGLENTASGKNLDTYFNTETKEGHALYNGFNMSRGTYKFYKTGGLNSTFNNKYDSNLEETIYAASVDSNFILDLVRYSNNRNTTLNKQFEEVFKCEDINGNELEYPSVVTDDACLGLYCDGYTDSKLVGGGSLDSYTVDRIDGYDATMEFKNDRIEINRNVQYKNLQSKTTDSVSLNTKTTRHIQWRNSAPLAYKSQPTEETYSTEKVLVMYNAELGGGGEDDDVVVVSPATGDLTSTQTIIAVFVMLIMSVCFALIAGRELSKKKYREKI